MPAIASLRLIQYPRASAPAATAPYYYNLSVLQGCDEMQLLQQSEGTAAQRRIFFQAVDATDGITAETGLTGVGRLSKNGAATAATSANIVEVDSTNMPGRYYIEFTGTELDTLGVIEFRYKAAACAEVVARAQVVPFDPYDAVRMGLTALPNAVPGAAGGVFIAGSNAATTVNITGNVTGNLSGSVGSVTGSVGSVTGAVGSVTGNVGGNVAGSVASVTGNVGGNVAGSVGSVTAAVTVGTNNDKTGYALSAAGIQAIWDALTSALTTVGSIGKLLVDNIDAAISSRSTYAGGAVASVTGNVGGNVVGSVGSVTGNVGGNVAGSVGSVTAAVTVGTNNDKTDYELSATGIQSIWTYVIDGVRTAEELLRGITSALLGKLSGAGTNEVKIRNIADTTDVITATVDADGNRTTVTLDLS